MTHSPYGQRSAGHSLAVAESRQEILARLNIDPRTGDYLIEDKGRAPGFNALRLIAIGSPYAVNNCRDRLHSLGYADPGEWSHPIPMSNTSGILQGLTPTDVMRILTKRIPLPRR